MRIPRRYNPKEAEPKWQKFWGDNGIYKFDPKGDKPIYSIDTPPPTVSGAIHIGHIFSYVQVDAVIRFWRMKGYNIFYPFGFDDNGLPTERFVEKKMGVKARDVPREEFIKMCLATTEETEKEFKRLWQSLGLSVDWSLIYSTIDDYVRKTSQRSFIELFQKGEVYRKLAPTLWCPECRTAIAQAETEDKEKTSNFNDILFELDDGKKVAIATTRPELIPACVAVLVHPNDERYTGYIGRKMKVPLSDREVPIITDEKVDPEKGTGVVMCCTFGDITDVEWWQKYDLDLRIVIDEKGIMNELADSYQGLDLKEARRAIVRDLNDEGLLASREEITHTVNAHERCGTDLELLVTPQWFIKVLDKKQELLEMGDKINWYPEFMKVRYVHWVENLQWDWCISRQRYYGVPFPLWICKECGEIILADDDQLPVDPTVASPKEPCRCGSTEFEPERDIMDTWTTSSMTPLINARWKEDEKFFPKLYPMDLRPQAHDIIRTWAFYTIIKGMLHTEDIPWRDIMISGHALSPGRRKLSKSKLKKVEDDVAGNPKLAIEKYSADAVRYWSCGTRLGTDCIFSEDVLKQGKRLATKLWNASKFAITNLEDYNGGKPDELRDIDKWMLTKLSRTLDKVNKGFDSYEFSIARDETEHFFWHYLCDNYIEIIKERLNKPGIYPAEARLSAQYGLYQAVLSVLKMMSPFMPHLTEEIFHLYFSEKENEETINLSRWPEVEDGWFDEEAEESGDLAVEVITAVRKRKSEANVSLRTKVADLTVACSLDYAEKLKRVSLDILAPSNADEILFVEEATEEFMDTSDPEIKVRVKLEE